MITTEEQEYLDRVVEEAFSQPTEEVIPNNSESLLVDETTTRFSSASWYEEAKKHTIILAGLGGVGSWTALLLSRLHPNSLHLYDNDMVEALNMAGQLYAAADIGSHKCTAISRKLSSYSDYYKASVYWKYTDGSPTSNIMICGFDNMKSRKVFFNKWEEHVNNLNDEDKVKCLFLDGRMSAEYIQIFCITGNDTYNKVRYKKNFLFNDEEAEEAICSYKQTSFCASMIGSLITNLYVNFCANRCNPLIERSLPFITEYNAETMFLKVES